MGLKKPAPRKSLHNKPDLKSGDPKPGTKPPRKSFSPKAKTEVKTRRPTAIKKAKKKYTAEQLGVPKLNGIIPVGVEKAKGVKKGKVFVDDAESMLAILGMVHAEKEGEREGKIMKARQLEEIREAKRVENERRTEKKRERLEEVKDEVRKKRGRKAVRGEKDGRDGKDGVKGDGGEQAGEKRSFKKKRVSFG